MTGTSWLRVWIICLCFTQSLSGLAQSHHNWDVQKNLLDSTLLSLQRNDSMEAAIKSRMTDSLFQLAHSLNLPCQKLEARILQSFSLDEMGLPDSALSQLLGVNAMLIPSCEQGIKWKLYGALTSIYLTLGEYQKIDSLAAIAKKGWLHYYSDYDIYFSILTNGAIAKALQGNADEATNLLHFILAEAKRQHNRQYIQKSLINLASIKGMMEQIDSAYYFLEKATANSRATDDVDAYVRLLINLAVLDLQEGRYKRAKGRLDTAEHIATKHNYLETRAVILDNQAWLAEVQNQYGTAYSYLREFLVLHDSLLNQTRVKAVTDMQAKYESEKKARQIQQLEIANLDANLKNEKIRHTRNRMIYIGAGILLAAIGLWTRLRLVHRSRRAIQKEKDISEGLLLNILPAAVAEELKAKGAAEAKLYEQATILFSDFKSFTEVASEMSAADLVNEINVCFKAFDEIMGQYGLEKIKTIGDSYMAAGAVPDDNKAEAIHVVQAALAMQDFIALRKQERDVNNQQGFEMRVGIHTGPVVAGIVGIKKFQYDLWGDTVNIASRMETNSEPGQVNISATTYAFVQHDTSLRFVERGMIEVKGKGEMMMYFVKRK